MKTAQAYDAGTARPFSSASGTICFSADSADGITVYSSEPDTIGKRLSEYGVPEDSLRDGFMDFAAISGIDYLMITKRDGDSVYYYAAETGTVFNQIVQTGAVISLIFAAALALLLVILLRGYNEETYREWEALRAEEQERIKLQHAKKEEKTGPAEDGEKKKNILQKLLPNERCGTMFGFFMSGGWKRGLNLFSLCSILLLIAIAYLINVICSLLLKLTGTVVSVSGETVIRLLYSCVRYVTVIAVFYFGLEYLGFSIGTIIASLSILSLALSPGAQDLIKDILAGLAIVFDGSFHIGDVVEISGTEGVVQEIGVRATKLTAEGNNTLYINNSEISRVLNKSRELTALDLALHVSAKESLLSLEELLNRELPKIGSRNDKIVKGPYLLGVTGLSSSLYTPLLKLSIEVTINQKDKEEVTSYLYREIRLLCERKGIELL